MPTTLAKDGRSRPPHLRTWRDGWRHLRFLLIYSPRWLFLYPGIVLFLLGMLGVVLLFPGELGVGGDHARHPHLRRRVHGRADRPAEHHLRRRRAALHARCAASCRRRRSYSVLLRGLTPDRLLGVGLILFFVSLLGLLWSVWQWVAVDFGPLTDQRILRVLTLSFTGLAASFQLGLAAFLESLMEIPLGSDPRSEPDRPRTTVTEQRR